MELMSLGKKSPGDYKEWPFEQARAIIDRLEKNKTERYRIETGFGPSGLPHIGTFGEVARSVFVMSALARLEPGLKGELIVFSDDLDGLRAPPLNIPNCEKIESQVGRPLSAIPDPFGQASSFASNMNQKLLSFLESFGFEFEFLSSTQEYRAGRFNEGLRRVLAKKDRIIGLFIPTISADKRARWSPFFPICRRCGSIYSTTVTSYDLDGARVEYVCDQPLQAGVSPCGDRAWISIFDGALKVGWKIDWALRWGALGIDYETHGEDLTESARLSTKIARLIWEGDPRPPILFKYELFLDETGRKISKKIGNGLSVDQWIRYGPIEALSYFIYDRPQKPKKMGAPIFPKIVDDYFAAVADYDGTEVDHPGAFIADQVKTRPIGSNARVGALYSLIYNLIIALGSPGPDMIYDYLRRYQPEIDKEKERYKELIGKVIDYHVDFHRSDQDEDEPSAPDPVLDPLIADLIARLKSFDGEFDPEACQDLLYQIARGNEIEPKRWFVNLYRILLGRSRGPRLGSFMTLLGKEKMIERLESRLADSNPSAS